jgi:hypothetical protein
VNESLVVSSEVEKGEKERFIEVDSAIGLPKKEKGSVSFCH